jgi:hypothetical protein
MQVSIFVGAARHRLKPTSPQSAQKTGLMP